MKSIKSKNRQLDFFMGANAPLGFVSLYDEFKVPKEGHRSYLIKGGAGTGKSGIIKRVAAAAENESLLERLHCSSDPNSLDGIILHDARCSMVDATPPHVIEPSFPGSYETVINLCEYFDEEKLALRLTKTVSLQAATSACHEKCRRFLRCADILLRDNTITTQQYTDLDKLNSFTKRLAKKLIPQSSSKKSGAEYRRLLSAVTNQGIVFYGNTVSTLCDRVWAIEDPCSAVAPYILEQLRDVALDAGYDLYCCYCPLSPGGRIEHILIPELSIGFVTQNAFIRYKGKTERVIHAERFTDVDRLNSHRQAIRFNRKAATSMFEAAVSALIDAKAIHDELERQYIDAVDFNAVDKKTDAIVKNIINR